MGSPTSVRRHRIIVLSAVLAFLVPFFVSAGAVEACVHDINVTKQVVGERLPDPSTEFTIRLVGAGGVFDETFRLADGETVGFVRVPAGTYVISEESIGPDAVTFLVDGVATDTLEIPATGADRTWELVVVNDYVGGRLSVEKQVIGNDPPSPDTVFEFELRPVAPTTGTNVPFSVLAGETWTSDWLPLGTYELVELNGPTGQTIVPNPITLDERASTVEVVVENPYFRGFIEVTKTETGETAPGSTYSFDVTGPVDFSFDLAADDTWTSGALPYGTYLITEVGAPTGSTVVPNPVVLDAAGAETVQVLVTNPYRDFRGRLAIEKVEADDVGLRGTYTMEVSGPVSFTTQVTAGETWTSDWLPLGTYTIVEVDAPADHTIVPNPAVLETDGATVLVTVTNTFSGVLPATGSDGVPVLVMSAAALVAAGLALKLVAVRRRRQMI